MLYWRKLTPDEQDERISRALATNIDYKKTVSLGIPASTLDPLVFHEQASFLKDAPLLRCYVQNPNHIGCHTLGESEPFFSGTQEIEREVIELLSVDMFKAAPDSCDGYIASGGTEANIQAIWIYRNYFSKEYNARFDEIAIISSEDTHYSVVKAANLLNLDWCSVPVDEESRTIIPGKLNETITGAKKCGKKYFIAIANMATTMFGSVDDPRVFIEHFKLHSVAFQLHVDAAFGGFVYPIAHPASNFNLTDPEISSVTLDAHKMLQAPYGTGIFIVRKGFMKYVQTVEAQYVNGTDLTLSGSRSGTNAVAIWMILMTYGPHGWTEKINKLLYRTDWLCKHLFSAGIPYFRYQGMNIVTIKASHISETIAQKFGLVPDKHQGDPEWYKVVVMDHVDIEHLKALLTELATSAGLGISDSRN